jgi:excisionase family DNA binding protein
VLRQIRGVLVSGNDKPIELEIFSDRLVSRAQAQRMRDGRTMGTSHQAEFISVEELSRRIGVSKQSIYRALDRNEIPGVFRLGRRVTINWSAVVAKSYEAP